jgi:hypothetical protein
MLNKELETAKELAAKAGNILLERYQENPSVSWKGGDAPGAAAEDIAESVSGVPDLRSQSRVGPSVTSTTETTGTARARTART